MCQNISNAEIFSGYEISVRTLQQEQTCISSLKIANNKEQKYQMLPLYTLKCRPTQIIRLGPV